MLRNVSIPGFVILCLFSIVLAACGSASSDRPAAIQAPADAAASEDGQTVPEPSIAAASTPDEGDPAVGASDTADLLPTPTPSPQATFDPNADSLMLAPVADGFERPLFLTHAGDGSGRLFIVEQEGRIHVLSNGERLAEPFLDIVERVNDGSNEQGLLGMAFDPDYAQNGRFFVNYTDADGATVVARYAVSADDPNRADPNSESVVLRIAQPARNHNAGMLAFGPDGYLYVGMGDGGAADDRFNNGQNPETLLGKMLRLDVRSDPDASYLIPPDNPWIAADWGGVDVPDEIWAVGLRNPWRYSFDRATGDLWIGDVGQRLYEEVNRVPADSLQAAEAVNFGWPIMEGAHCFPDDDSCDQTGLALPVAEYTHEGGACSVTGGYVYRGAAFPALQGVYFFADYCSGEIWALQQRADGAWQQQVVIEDGGNVASFGEDEAGELYVLDLSAGTVMRLVMGEE